MDNHWVVLAHPIGKSGNALETINTYVSYGLWSLVIGSSIVLLIDSWKLTRGEQKQAA